MMNTKQYPSLSLVNGDFEKMLVSNPHDLRKDFSSLDEYVQSVLNRNISSGDLELPRLDCKQTNYNRNLTELNEILGRNQAHESIEINRVWTSC